MKLNIQIIIYILILGMYMSCESEQKLIGNYSVCESGEYLEVYFKKDSIRVASRDSWINLSEWRKIEIKNDTLHFETFGEYRDSTKAEIKHLTENNIQLNFFKTNDTLNLEPINSNLNFENSKIFWEDFHNRLISMRCIMEE